MSHHAGSRYDKAPKNPYFVELEFEVSRSGATVRYATRVESATETAALGEAERKFRARFQRGAATLVYWATRQRFWVDA